MKLKPYQDLNSGEKTLLVELMFFKNPVIDKPVINRIPKETEIESFYDKFSKACEVLKSGD